MTSAVVRFAGFALRIWIGSENSFSSLAPSSITNIVHYLDKLELDAMLAAAKQRELTAQGRRDYAMLLFLYNTGARADEAAGLTITDLHLTPTDWNGQAYVQIRGKGGRTRQCPLWPATVREIENSIGKRLPHEHVF